ncbi:uncharacterized protein MELLADRAFT_111635 [Melampsora larici-populina 98AG31]|uniref:Uncharacterized protein n=1 Tax=Melampsora larici-populina (strain 98AG31 / pathotype 3-4-7) TaxID=747676 RepID=F4S3U8_MELLP|nr:uncharacterized protein MELLADRAFT_111635 [Melampsora larici-populina 98AG31]EGG00598.1 hypothetical protein MELLADRAFT_111635 [Melampsora larici-populina 98AG31]
MNELASSVGGQPQVDLRTEDEIEGTDDPSGVGSGEKEEELDGETIDENQRDKIARQMEDYHTGITDLSASHNNNDQNVNFINSNSEEENEESTAKSTSGSSSNSSSGGSSESSSDKDSNEDTESNDSLSTDSKSDSSYSSNKKNRKCKLKSIKSLDKAVEKAIKMREKFNSEKKDSSQAMKEKKDHGKGKAGKKKKSSSSKKTKVSKQNGIKFQAGVPCKSLLPTLQTYWNEAMLKLNEKVPLTVLNPTFVQHDQDESHKNQSSSSSSKKTRKKYEKLAQERAGQTGEWSFGNTNPKRRSVTSQSSSRQNSSHHPSQQRAPRVVRVPRLPEIIEMLPPAQQIRPNDKRDQRGRNGIRRGRGGGSIHRGRANQPNLQLYNSKNVQFFNNQSDVVP